MAHGLGTPTHYAQGVRKQNLAGVAVLVVGVGLACWQLGRTNLGVGVVAGVIGLVLVIFLAWMSTRRGPHTPWPAAVASLGLGHAIVLWKPGCTYCELLRVQYRRDHRLTWVNVWADEDANVVVRRLNDGMEYTPTVLVGDEVLKNPSAHELRAALDASAAHPGDSGDESVEAAPRLGDEGSSDMTLS